MMADMSSNQDKSSGSTDATSDVSEALPAASHRGPHPSDRKTFLPESVHGVANAVADLGHLLTREYGRESALKLVGDRYRLTARQRVAVDRMTCSDSQLHSRIGRERSDLRGASVVIDGFNLLTTVEAALGGALILDCRDTCYRDMAGTGGSYRVVAETVPAMDVIGAVLREAGVVQTRVVLDQPVQNSGRVKALWAESLAKAKLGYEIQIANGVDGLLRESPDVVVSADSEVIDACMCWSSLARRIVQTRIPTAWVLGTTPSSK
ncbi:MAG: DUF434 domain-containing protein [Phycisphaerales bacterium]